MLTNKEEKQLKLGLKGGFVDKNKNIKKILTDNMERVAERVTNSFDQNQVEYFHEVMRIIQTFSLKIYLQPNITHINLKDIIRDKDLVIINGDKDSSVVAMNRTDYNNIMQKIADDGIKSKIYEVTTDNNLKNLKFLQEFLYSNFKDYENYDDVGPVSNQLAKLHGTAKTHRFENFEGITPLTLNVAQL